MIRKITNHNVLVQKETRQHKLLHAIKRRYRSILFLSSNCASSNMLNHNGSEIVAWGIRELLNHFADIIKLDEGVDDQGQFIILGTIITEARSAKIAGLLIEGRPPVGHMIDIDVYDRLGKEINRHTLGCGRRRCLTCWKSGYDSSGYGRHDCQPLTSNTYCEIAMSSSNQ